MCEEQDSFAEEGYLSAHEEGFANGMATLSNCGEGGVGEDRGKFWTMVAKEQPEARRAETEVRDGEARWRGETMTKGCRRRGRSWRAADGC